MELIQISVDARGVSTVSARELHGFLEVKSKFADWFKNRVTKYALIEGQDFVAFSKNLENGGRELDYALTLDCAKELAMVQNNEKGRTARQYFIDCEKQLRQIVQAPPALSGAEQALLRQLLTRVDQLQQEIVDLRQQQQLPAERPAFKPSPANAPLRQLVVRQILAYAHRNDLAIRDAYTYFYGRLLNVHGVDVFAINKPVTLSYLDALDRAGHIERLYGLIVEEAGEAGAY